LLRLENGATFRSARRGCIMIWLNATMGKVPPSVLELPVAERGLIALKAAVEKVIVEHARQGVPIYIWRDSRVVEVSQDELRAQAILLSTESA